jgi:hypothetical protein
MFNVYKNQQSRQTGSRNPMGSKTLPTIWGINDDVKKISIWLVIWKYLELLDILKVCLYPRSPKGEGGILFYLCPSVRPSVRPSKIFSIAFFSVTVDGRNPYMFNVYKNQQSRQTGSRNPMGSKTLPTIWYTYMMLVTKYQISAIKTIDDRNLIFGHKLHIGMPYCGKRFWTRQIPTSCLPILYLYEACDQISDFCHQ